MIIEESELKMELPPIQDSATVQYQYYLADQLQLIQRFCQAYHAQITCPITMPGAPPPDKVKTIQGMAAEIYTLLIRASKLEPLNFNRSLQG